MTEMSGGSDRSTGTIRFGVKNLSRLRNQAESPGIYVRDLLWKIQVKPQPWIMVNETPEWLAVYITCEIDHDHYCLATTELKLISNKPNKKHHTVNCHHLYTSDHTNFGDSKFIKWCDVLNPDNGYLKANGNIILEAIITAEVPLVFSAQLKFNLLKSAHNILDTSHCQTNRIAELQAQVHRSLRLQNEIIDRSVKSHNESNRIGELQNKIQSLNQRFHNEVIEHEKLKHRFNENVMVQEKQKNNSETIEITVQDLKRQLQEAKVLVMQLTKQSNKHVDQIKDLNEVVQDQIQTLQEHESALSKHNELRTIIRNELRHRDGRFWHLHENVFNGQLRLQQQQWRDTEEVKNRIDLIKKCLWILVIIFLGIFLHSRSQNI